MVLDQSKKNRSTTIVRKIRRFETKYVIRFYSILLSTIERDSKRYQLFDINLKRYVRAVPWGFDRHSLNTKGMMIKYENFCEPPR